MRLRIIALLLVVLAAAAVVPAVAQNRGNAEATIKGKKVKITYGRPSLRGRDMLSMARPGDVWRLGMDDATEIESAGDLVVAAKTLKAGKYSLWAKKTGADTWILAFHPKTGLWGDPPLTSGYAAEMPLTVGKAVNSAETLTIALAPDKAGDAAITIHWGGSQLTGSFGVK